MTWMFVGYVGGIIVSFILGLFLYNIYYTLKYKSNFIHSNPYSIWVIFYLSVMWIVTVPIAIILLVIWFLLWFSGYIIMGFKN